MALRANHDIVANPLHYKHVGKKPKNKKDVALVASYCRKFRFLDNPCDASLVETLLTPSPQRDAVVYDTVLVLDEDLKDELEQLEAPLAASGNAWREARYRHLVDWAHEQGLFDDGEEKDLAKFRGDLPVDEHLEFWRQILKDVDDELTHGANVDRQMAEEEINPDLILERRERFSDVVKAYGEIMETPFKAGLFSDEVKAKYGLNEIDALNLSEMKTANELLTSELAAADSNQDDAAPAAAPAAANERNGDLQGYEMVDSTSMTKLKLVVDDLNNAADAFNAAYEVNLKSAVDLAIHESKSHSTDLQSYDELVAAVSLFDDSRRAGLELVSRASSVLEAMTRARQFRSDPLVVASALEADNRERIRLSRHLADLSLDYNSSWPTLDISSTCPGFKPRNFCDYLDD